MITHNLRRFCGDYLLYSPQTFNFAIMDDKNRYASYIWQRSDWPKFRWDADLLLDKLSQVCELYGQLSGRLLLLDEQTTGEALLSAMSQELTSSWEIEGIMLNPLSVGSSLAHRLGIEQNVTKGTDHYIEGLVEVLFDAKENCQKPLTAQRLKNWHAALFPTGRSGPYQITVGDYRQGEEPMQVVSGPLGKQKVHYEAPPSHRVENEMVQFLQWLNSSTLSPFIMAGLAHLRFLTIHPFDDGNGRLSRTIADMILSRHASSTSKYISVSAEINREKTEYYAQLERAQRGNLDVTDWLIWFLDCVHKALQHTEQALQTVLLKSLYWKQFADKSVNERQRKIINRLWDGFFGKLTSSKYAKICHCSQDTATRDINDLMAKRMLCRSPEGGRSTHYILPHE